MVSFIVGDHPRSRGVYRRASRSGSVQYGSSPLARGLHGRRLRPPLRRRIIPARAGFTQRLRERRRGRPGSSPLARGLPEATSAEEAHPGIIPARAGFTDDPVQAGGDESDHPRSRGVYLPVLARGVTGEGSSPLARGLRGARRSAPILGGIIPARAGFTTSRWDPGDRPQDHPRSRGVYPAVFAATYGRAGSSPLARGLPLLGGLGGPQGRIIPARAGFTRRRRGRPRSAGDHPRSRGVYRPCGCAGPARGGSSPLARGLPPRGTPRDHPRRIIPARAGFTRAGRRAWRPPADHPRSRGVYQSELADGWGALGSSPLARGLPLPTLEDVGLLGIIPARAGFTRDRGEWAGRARDHPRSRGVYLAGAGARPSRTGSSPLARGLPDARHPLGAVVGIIPARAGFTDSRCPRRIRRGDHPRSRGVYTNPAAPPPSPTGSSPLARGLLPLPGRPVAGPRIIPARAGFTSPGLHQTVVSEDHPRSRGVYLVMFVIADSASGSSPLARGLPGPAPPRRRDPRIIPARAGFTPIAPSAPASAGGSSPLARGLLRVEHGDHRRRRIIPARAGFTDRDGTGPVTAADHPRSRGVYCEPH